MNPWAIACKVVMFSLGRYYSKKIELPYLPHKSVMLEFPFSNHADECVLRCQIDSIVFRPPDFTIIHCTNQKGPNVEANRQDNHFNCFGWAVEQVERPPRARLRPC